MTHKFWYHDTKHQSMVLTSFSKGIKQTVILFSATSGAENTHFTFDAFKSEVCNRVQQFIFSTGELIFNDI